MTDTTAKPPFAKLTAWLKAVSLAAILLPSSAAAEVSAAKIVQALQSGENEAETLGLAFISGVERGLLWTNTYARVINDGKQTQPVYCPPANLGLNGKQVASIFEGFVAKNPSDAERPAAFVVLLAMRDSFPCR